MSINNSNILDKINKDNWDIILEELESGRIDAFTIINDNPLCYIAALNNKKDVIEYYSKNKKLIPILEKNGIDGLNSYHIMAKLGYTDLLEQSLKYNKDAINLTDDNGNTIMFYLVTNLNDTFENFAKTYTNIDYDIVNGQEETIMLKCIDETNGQKDKYFDRIKLIISKGASPNIPNTNYPLIYSIKLKKEIVAKLLIDNNECNLNIKDSNYLTPFLVAVYNELNDIVNLLIKHCDKFDINYSGAEGDQNPLLYLINKENDELINLLLKNGFDCNKYNRTMDTPLHLAFKITNKIKPSLVSTLLYYGDLNIQNINGETPLYLFMKNYDWTLYDIILENKKLDIYIKDKKGNILIDLIPDKDIIKFLDMVTKSFINNYKQYSDKICKSIDNTSCFNKIKEYIIKNNCSYINTENEDDIKMITGSIANVSRGIFNSDILHNVVYTMIVLNRNKTLGIPYQYYSKSKYITMKELNETLNFFNDGYESVLHQLITLYNDFFFGISPYLILWRNKDVYYIDKDIDFYSQKCLKSDNIRFIFYKLTLIISEQGTHANIIIFDKETGILERFEPYGNIPYLDGDSLDNLIKDKLGSFLSEYLKKNNKELTYYGPKDLISGVSFQVLSDDTNSKVKKLGDPGGFCLAWTLWYLEMRIKNPDVNPKDLIRKAINKIKSIDKEEYPDQIFIDFIRNYAAELDSDKNKLLIEMGINESIIYNLKFNEKDNMKIINGLSTGIDKIMDKRVN